MLARCLVPTGCTLALISKCTQKLACIPACLLLLLVFHQSEHAIGAGAGYGGMYGGGMYGGGMYGAGMYGAGPMGEPMLEPMSAAPGCLPEGTCYPVHCSSIGRHAANMGRARAALKLPAP